MADITKGIYRRIYAGYIWGKRLCAVPIASEAWFWRLHAVADDYGNLPAEETRLVSEVRGYRKERNADILRACADLEKVRLIAPYTSESETFYHIISFEQMQPAPRNGKRVRKYPPHPPEIDVGNPGESGCIQIFQASHSHTQIHTQDQPPPKVSEVVLPEVLNTDAFKAAWSEWEAHRKALRVRAYTPQGLSRQYSALAKMGAARAVAAIQHSISHNWQGIFEASGKGTAPAPQQRALPTGAWT